MITVKILEPGMYKLTETIMSCGDSKISHWYYDFNRNLISEHPDFPDSMKTRPISDVQRDWFNKYYKHKAQE